MEAGKKDKLFLIVDDEEVVRDVLRRYFTRQGVRVVLAKDAEEALGQLRREPPAVMLLDIKMPGMDGLELLKEVRTKYAGLPVLMITAVDDAGTAELAMRLGARDYIPKPIDLDYLDTSASVHAMLEGTAGTA